MLHTMQQNTAKKEKTKKTKKNFTAKSSFY